jgi:RND family efflux transporter MFP subunit
MGRNTLGQVMVRGIVIGLFVIVAGSLSYFYFIVGDENPSEVNVKVAPVQEGPFTASVLAQGKIIAQKKDALTSPIAGVVQDMGFQTGQHLRRGTVVARVRLPDVELSKKRKDLEFATIDLEILDEQFAQANDLLQAKAISEREYKELKTRRFKQNSFVQSIREELTDKVVRTSLNGLLVEKLFRHDDKIGAGGTLATIVDTASFAVKIAVPQHLLVLVKDGQRVEYSSQLFQGVRAGYVLEIARVANSQNTQYGAPEVEAVYGVVASIQRLPSDSFFLDSQVDARFVIEEIGRSIFIPQEAVLYRKDTTLVFVSADGKATTRYITLGLTNDRFVQIRSGLTVGDTVITTGNLDLEDGTLITQEKNLPDHDQAKPRGRVRLFVP